MGKVYEKNSFQDIGTEPWKTESKRYASVIAPACNVREFLAHGADRGNRERACEMTPIEDTELRVQAERGGSS